MFIHCWASSLLKESNTQLEKKTTTAAKRKKTLRYTLVQLEINGANKLWSRYSYTKKLHLFYYYIDFFFYQKYISSSRAVKILYLSFTCEDIGVAMVTNMLSQFTRELPTSFPGSFLYFEKVEKRPWERGWRASRSGAPPALLKFHSQNGFFEIRFCCCRIFLSFIRI